MADEPKNGGENGDDAERPRRSKPSSGTFDPVEFGQQILGAGEGDAPPPRGPRPTLTDEAELEEARRRSIDAGPKGALSLANFHAPSVPPAPASSAPLFQAELTEFDLGWDEESPTVPRNVDAPEAGATPASEQKVTAPPPGGNEASFADLNDDEHDEPAPPTRPAEVPPELVEESQRSEPRPAEPEDTPPPKAEGPPSAVEMADRVALGDFSGALEIAERLLELDPAHAEAQKVADEARETLLAMYTARIGDLEAVPVVAVAREELRWLSIDHRAGFVLSLVDGVSTVEMVLDVSGMPRFDALRLLHELLQKRIISIR